MSIKNLFDNKNYPTIIYLMIIIMSLLIIFNFANLVNPKTTNESKINSFIIKELPEKIVMSKEKLYYYLFIEIQIVFILAVLKRVHRK